MDYIARQLLWDAIKVAMSDGTAFLITMDSLESCLRWCSTAALMNKGKLLYIGNPSCFLKGATSKTVLKIDISEEISENETSVRTSIVSSSPSSTATHVSLDSANSTHGLWRKRSKRRTLTKDIDEVLAEIKKAIRSEHKHALFQFDIAKNVLTCQIELTENFQLDKIIFLLESFKDDKKILRYSIQQPNFDEAFCRIFEDKRDEDSLNEEVIVAIIKNEEVIDESKAIDESKLNNTPETKTEKSKESKKDEGKHGEKKNEEVKQGEHKKDKKKPGNEKNVKEEENGAAKSSPFKTGEMTGGENK